jgi:lysophospholipase L1-like esterase
MMNKKIIWIIFLLITVIFTAVFLGGFIISINITSSNIDDESVQEEPLEGAVTDKEIKVDDSQEGDMFTILILGDSIGAGVGDDTGLGLGKGYGKLIEKDISREIIVVNLAQPGAEISDMMKVLDDDETIRIISSADIVLISIGGNDVNHLMNSRSQVSTINYEETLERYLVNLGKALVLINENNSDVQRAIIGLYNPYGDEVDEETREMLLNWNYRTELLISSYPNSIYIPTHDLFKYNLDDYLTIDDFHPSADGYNAIVERLYKVLNGEEKQ